MCYITSKYSYSGGNSLFNNGNLEGFHIPSMYSILKRLGLMCTRNKKFGFSFAMLVISFLFRTDKDKKNGFSAYTFSHSSQP